MDTTQTCSPFDYIIISLKITSQGGSLGKDTVFYITAFSLVKFCCSPLQSTGKQDLAVWRNFFRFYFQNVSDTRVQYFQSQSVSWMQEAFPLGIITEVLVPPLRLPLPETWTASSQGAHHLSFLLSWCGSVIRRNELAP